MNFPNQTNASRATSAAVPGLAKPSEFEARNLKKIKRIQSNLCFVTGLNVFKQFLSILDIESHIIPKFSFHPAMHFILFLLSAFPAILILF